MKSKTFKHRIMAAAMARVVTQGFAGVFEDDSQLRNEFLRAIGGSTV